MYISLFALQVFVGGASEGLLELGDRILSINSHNTTNISHFEAQHLFRSADESPFFPLPAADRFVFRTSGTMVQLEVVRLVCCPVPAHRNHSRLQSDIQVSRGGLGFGGTLSPCAPGPAQHPGYVTAAAPHLPAPRHPAAAAKPQESETFKLVLRQEMGTARNQTGISARSFPAPSHASSQASNHCHAPRPVSQLSDTSDTDWTDVGFFS